MTEHPALLRWLDGLRRAPLWLRIILALAITAIAFAGRVAVHDQRTGVGRDMLFIGVLSAALLLGLVPGLFAAVAARVASLWWFVGPPEVTMVQPWNAPGVTIILLLSVVAAALAGDALRSMSRPVNGRDDRDR